MSILVYVTLFFLVPYSLVMFLVWTGLLRLGRGKEAKPLMDQKVTVVVPFRNEACHLPDLISDLVGQSYPVELYSVLLVNDHSTDGSLDVAKSLSGGRPRFVCLDLPEGAKGKKAALGYAIPRVESEWIIQTDADCRLGPDFVSAHMAWLGAHPSDLVAGWVTTRREGNGFLEAFERLEMLGLSGTGAGSYMFHRPVMCSGANLLYSKSLFLETRSFDPAEKSTSGDDMFLMIGARKLGKSLSFNPGRPCMVQTGVAGDIHSLFRQRVRWGGKSIHYRMADIQLLALLVVAASILVVISPAWMLLYPGSARWLMAGIGIKTTIDFLVLHATTGMTGQRKTLWWFLPVALLYYPYMLVVSAGSLLGRSSWKGREV